MNKQAAAVAGILTCTLLLVTACGPQTMPATVPMTNSVTIKSDSNLTNSTDGTTVTPINLVPFTGASSQGIQVQVPDGWIQAPVQGGDYTGWKFTNPSAPNETELVVTSSCVGCYLDANGKADPALVIPQTDEHVQTTKQTSHAVTYTFTQQDSLYPGHGILITTTDKSGYAYVETQFPSEQTDKAMNVLSTFSLSR